MYDGLFKKINELNSTILQKKEFERELLIQLKKAEEKAKSDDEVCIEKASSC